MFVKDITFLSKDLKTKKVEETKTYCNLCQLYKQAHNIVKTELGLYNIMVIGEAPGYNEDIQGLPFIGLAGQLVWEELYKYHIHRQEVCIANICKCYPRINKTPTDREINCCSKILKQEIKLIKPKHILCFGNTSLKAFTDKSTGILEYTGRTYWFDEYNAGITFCIHPASALYQDAHKRIFQEGIKAFVEQIKE